jgi:ribosome-associated toxin RatA of RatAB toxin-antitoxin module
MGHITITRVIGAPIETVFTYVDDHKNTTKYMKGLTRWSPTTDVVHGKDAEFEVVMKAGPANLRSVVHITAWAENRTIGWKSVDGFKQNGKWAFSEKGDRTQVVLDMDYEFGGGIAGRMLGKAAETPVRWNLEHSVEALKEQTERLKPKSGSGGAASKSGETEKAAAGTAAGAARARGGATRASATAKSGTAGTAAKTTASAKTEGGDGQARRAKSSRSTTAKAAGPKPSTGTRKPGSSRTGR